MEREYFHKLMNIESYPDFLPNAKSIAEKYLQDARDRLNDKKDIPEILYRFDFSHDAFSERLDKIFHEYANEIDEKLDRNTAKGREYFEFWTRDRIRERLIQFAPFNLTDGAWLQYIARAGTPNRVQSMLFSIWADEVGNGKEAQNHSNIYWSLLASMGIVLPEVNSREFAHSPLFLDSAFCAPVFQLAVAEFSTTFFPEIIGMTLFIEWNSPTELRIIVERLKEFGIDPLFYSLHIAIDNPLSGHGAFAREIVGLYLDDIRRQGGEKAVQEHWQRIWDGYAAFQIVGTLAEDLQSKLGNPQPFEERMLQIIRNSADKAQRMHGDKTLIDPSTGEARLINDFFKDPEGLLKALVENRLVIPGKPDESRFLSLLNFEGRMHRVFSEEEVEVIRKWIISLEPATPEPKSTASPGLAMMNVLDDLREIAKHEASHKGFKLSGPDPRDPDKTREESVAWWFDKANATTLNLMRALASDARYVALSEPDNSLLVTRFLAPSDRRMAVRLGPERIEVIRNWIARGAPDPEEKEEYNIFALFLDTELPQASVPRRRILGMGAVH